MADREYTIVHADGRELTIVGPDNATPDQLRSAAERAFASKKETSDKLDTNVPPELKEKAKQQAISNVLGFRSERKGDVAEQVAAHPIARFAVGAASPIIGLADRLAGNSNVLQRFGEMSKAGGAEGFDAPGLAGTMMNPLGLGMAGAMPAATGIVGRTVQGAGMGAVGGFTAPAENNREAMGNALVGAGLGAAFVPMATGAAKLSEWASNNVIRPVSDLFTKQGPMNIANRYIRGEKVVGEQNMPAVLNAVRNIQPTIPGAKPTVGEAVSAIPEGSPVNALQAIVAKTPGGPSAAFGQRALDQEAAVQAAEQARNAVTGPMRTAALTAANQPGVPSAQLVQQIDAMATKPGDRASDVVVKTLGSIRNKIASLGGSGAIDAQDLYTIRKEIGNTIQQHAKETANWDKRLSARLERDIQLKIDDAIEAAGGVGWKNYLAEYAKRSQAIDADKARRELAKNPLQPTNLSGGINVAEETRPHMPNLLSRPAMMMNFIMRKAGAGVEPKVDAALAEILLDPSKFDQVMSRLPPQTQVNVQGVLQRANALAFGAGASQ